MFETYTITQVAKKLNVHRMTVYFWITKGIKVGGDTVRLKAEKIGQRWMIREDALRAFINQVNQK